MDLQGIVDDDPGHIAIAREGAVGASGIVQGDVEIVDVIQGAGNSLAVGQGDGDRAGRAAGCGGYRGCAASTSGAPAASAAGRKPVTLELLRGVAAANPLQVAGSRVTCAAFAWAVEVGLTFLGIAGK